MKKSRIASLSFTFVALVALVSAIVYRQDIYDWSRLRSYTPPPEIVALAENTTMDDDARRLFYVHHPLIAEKDIFNDHCRDNEHTIVLGCYVQHEGIYLLEVSDERLSGIKEVTAAHELLHAAYDRLNSKERTRIDKLLLEVFADIDNARLNETVDLYRQQNPAIVPNELHSIIGTEVRSLPTELEDYYGRYFSNRKQIVSYAEQYEQAFVERRNQIRVYDEQLADLKVRIEQLQADLATSDSQLRAQRDLMNKLRNEGKTDEYNAQVPSYNSKVNAFNRDIDTLSALIVQYNDIVQRRNEVASEEAELVEAIDSREVVPQQQ